MNLVTIKTFKFNELSEKSKQVAIDQYRDSDHLDYEWYDYSKSDFHSILEIIGFTNIDSGFSGFCCQGDGANFTADYSYKSGCLKAIKQHTPIDSELQSIMQGIISHMKDYGYKLECHITRYNTRYEHSNTMLFDWTMRSGENVNWKKVSVEDEINQLFRDMADWYYTQLEKEYDYLNSDECIAELLESNDYDYLESGKQYF